jgi:hypothetical protein
MHKILRSWRKFSGDPECSNTGIDSRQACPEFRRRGAKYAKFGNQFLFFAPFAFFARDIPRLTGARSAPYENLRVLRAFVANPTFLILVAALPR